jgi:ribosomal protein L13, bacterial type
MRQTTMIKPSEVVHAWYVVDATDCTLGRLATAVATVLRGKNKPTYTPNVDCGDYVIVINADKVKVTGDQDHKKEYFSHSMFPGGLRVRSTKNMPESPSRHPGVRLLDRSRDLRCRKRRQSAQPHRCQQESRFLSVPGTSWRRRPCPMYCGKCFEEYGRKI